jgi:hypothetical protein
MSLLSLKPEEVRSCFPESDIFPQFKLNREKDAIINEAMTPQQIGDLVSDRLMDVIKKQFEAAKEKFLANQANE